MSNLRHLTDPEFLLRLDDARHQSPIIGELCRRMEYLLRQEPTAAAYAECPVCQANIRVDYDVSNEILSLQVNT